jgi:hypothetical protein
MENIGNPTINYGAVIDSPNIVCECGCKTFAPAAILKKVSKIVTMTGRDQIVAIPVYVCTKCGNIPQEYMDKGNAARILGESKDSSANQENKSGLII